MTARLFFFVGGEIDPWRVVDISIVVGGTLADVTRLNIVTGAVAGCEVAPPWTDKQRALRDSTGEIDELFVRPQVRAIGIGGKLLQAAEAAFVAAGCTNVALQLARSNDAGRAFYIRHGYSPRSGYELLDKILIVG